MASEIVRVEKAIHEAIYENLNLLRLIYPTSKNFNEVFARDMFVKNNKTASQQVIYYLLHVLDPISIKKKILTWPIQEIKDESKFRAEILRYLNELNTIYEYADIPKVMMTHLLSPGGLKFARIIFFLSQLVMFEHLQRSGKATNLLYPAVAGKSGTDIKKINAKIENECIELKEQFEINLKIYKQKAADIEKSCEEYKKLLIELKSEDVSEEEIDLDEIDQKIDAFKNNLKDFETFTSQIECVNYLEEHMGVLEYKLGDLNIPNEVKSVLNPNTNKLDLFKFFDFFKTFLRRKFFEIKTINKEDAEYFLNTFKAVESELKFRLEKYEDLLRKFKELKIKLDEICLIPSK